MVLPVAVSSNNLRFPLKVVADSKNLKLSHKHEVIAATYRPIGLTCPLTCQFLPKSLGGTADGGCYAGKGRVNMHQVKSAEDYHDLERVLGSGARIIRHHVSGDFVKDGGQLDLDYVDYVFGFHRSHGHIQGFAYTHAIRAFVAAGFKPSDIPSNFSLLASSDSQEDIDAARLYGFQYSRVVAGESNALASKTAGEIVCPQQLAKNRGRVITCTDCGVCIQSTASVIFIKH